jgi:alanine racemase
MYHPTRALIDTAAVAENYRRVVAAVGAGTRVCPVLKANAYGHGLREVGTALDAAGAGWFAVATADEGLSLREALPDADILVLLPAFADADSDRSAEMLLRRRLRPTVIDRPAADALDRTAARLGTRAAVHVEIDTGMGRMGVPLDEAEKLLTHVSGCRNLKLEGVFTHFAEAESVAGEFTRNQLDRFYDCLAHFEFGPETAGLSADDSRFAGFTAHSGGRLILHAANSAAALAHPRTRLNMVRCGLAIYGYPPSEGAAGDDSMTAALRPAMKVVSRLVAVKSLPAGHTVGYGRTWTATRDTVTGVVPIGYEDGYPRSLSNNAVMRVRGRYVPVIGRVSMDQTVVDLTDVPAAAAGDEVTVVCDDPRAPNALAALAERAGTIPYEMLCRLGNRVRRVYV